MRDRHAAPAALVGGDGLLRDAELLGQLDLGDALILAQAVDAGAELDEEGAFVVADGHGGRGGRVEVSHTVSVRLLLGLTILQKRILSE